MRRISIAVATLALVGASACGGSDKATGTTNNNTSGAGDGAISMTVNGTAWRSLKTADRVSKSGNIYAIVGLNLPYTLSLGIAGLTGPGTVNLDLATGQGSQAIVSNSTGGWGTAFTGGSGTITVTTLTANRIAGTFSFDAKPGSGNATGTLQVRNGRFDVTF